MLFVIQSLSDAAESANEERESFISIYQGGEEEQSFRQACIWRDIYGRWNRTLATQWQQIQKKQQDPFSSQDKSTEQEARFEWSASSALLHERDFQIDITTDRKRVECQQWLVNCSDENNPIWLSWVIGLGVRPDKLSFHPCWWNTWLSEEIWSREWLRCAQSSRQNRKRCSWRRRSDDDCAVMNLWSIRRNECYLPVDDYRAGDCASMCLNWTTTREKTTKI